MASPAPRALSPAHLRVHFARQVSGPRTHLLLQRAAGARARAGAGAVLVVRLQVAHGAGGGERVGRARRRAPARRWKGRGERCAPGVRGGVAVGGARGGERGGRRDGLGSHQVWRVREAGRHWEPEPSRSGRRLRLFTATAECAGGGSGSGGGGRAPGEGAGAGRRRGAGAGTGLSWGRASPPPSSRSPGERAANPRRPLRARPGPGRCASAPGGAFPLSPLSSLSLFSFPFPFLQDKFLNFGELAHRTFLKGPRALPRRPSPREAELSGRHPAPLNIPASAAPREGLLVVGFRK